jgi:hypothetical protein
MFYGILRQPIQRWFNPSLPYIKLFDVLSNGFLAALGASIQGFSYITSVLSSDK